jgi:hypothetical protein
LSRNETQKAASIVNCHIREARGYLALGLLNEASDELEAIAGAERLSVEVLEPGVDLYTLAK